MKRLLAAMLALFLLLSVTACGQPSENGNDRQASAVLQPEEPPVEPVPDTEPTPDTEPDASAAPVVPAGPVLSPKEQAVAGLLSTMTLEEKVGQMFFVRCPEVAAADKASQYHLGGYLLFGRDFKGKTAEQVKADIASYQAAAEIPLLIGVDEEGGTVRRISGNSALWPRKFQSPQRVWAGGGAENVTADTEEKNQMLRTYGVNVNFAPVADVSTDPNDFIYDRALGQDAAATAHYVAAVVDAMEAGQIGSVLKHFPGYGSNVDTHTGIALDDRPYEQFMWQDFLPFQAGIAEGADAVLVSHNIVACMDSSLPASLSPEPHRILREELGFEGVILTDDLAMDAVEAYAADGSVAVLAALAGNDMIVTTDFETQIPQVIAAVEEGVLSQETIDAAVSRVLGWKYDLGLI